MLSDVITDYIGRLVKFGIEAGKLSRSARQSRTSASASRAGSAEANVFEAAADSRYFYPSRLFLSKVGPGVELEGGDFEQTLTLSLFLKQR